MNFQFFKGDGRGKYKMDIDILCDWS